MEVGIGRTVEDEEAIEKFDDIWSTIIS